MHNYIFSKINLYILFFSIFLSIFILSQFLSACTETNNHPSEKKSSQKISSSLMNAIHEPESDRTKGKQLFFDKNIRVDEKGRIQIYINLYKLDKAGLDELKTHGVEIDIYDKAENLVQGWASPQNIKAISELSFVKFIDLPTYGVSN